MVKYTGRGLVVKRPGVLSKVQMLNLVLGVGVFSILPNWSRRRGHEMYHGPRGSLSALIILETGIGGSNPRKLEGGVENFEFPGAPESDPFLQRSYEIVILGVQGASLQGATFGASPPPLAFGTF